MHEKDIIHYLFDFGDDWWHRIRVNSIKEADSKKKYIKLIKSVGESPPQYPDYDDNYMDSNPSLKTDGLKHFPKLFRSVVIGI